MCRTRFTLSEERDGDHSVYSNLQTDDCPMELKLLSHPSHDSVKEQTGFTFCRKRLIEPTAFVYFKQTSADTHEDHYYSYWRDHKGKLRRSQRSGH